MRFEHALALDYLLHLRHMSAGDGRLFSTAQASAVRRDFGRYINGTERPNIVVLRSLYRLLKGTPLPLPLVEPQEPVNKVAIEMDKVLVLLHWTANASDRKEWERKFNGLDLHRKDTYRFKDGGEIAYETCGITYRNISILRIAGFDVRTSYRKVESLVPVDMSCLDGRLFPYQVEGVRMLETGYRLLADEQGLGKTATTLQYANLHKEFGRVLICCPASLKLNWCKEVRMWTDEKDAEVLSGSVPYAVGGSKYLVVNYDVLPYWVDTLCGMDIDLVVADECHYVQNEKARRTQAFCAVARHAKDAIYISGTPFTSKPFQMYTALHNIAPGIFSNQYEYGIRFCGGKYESGRWSFNGATNLGLLHAILQDGICIRRLKADVLTQLPEKRRVTVPLMSEKLDAASKGAIDDLNSRIAQSNGALCSFEFERQIAYYRKREAVLDWIRNFLDTGNKLVVFAVHKATIDDIMSAFRKVAVKIDGSTSMQDRDKAVESFQHDDDVRLFVGNVKAAGTGLTLTAASDIAVVEYDWSFGAMLQAEDRIHRIGAKNACTIYYLTCPGTIDEHIVDIINRKAMAHTKIFDDADDSMLDTLRSMRHR